jgi:hypothetical protein
VQNEDGPSGELGARGLGKLESPIRRIHISLDSGDRRYSTEGCDDVGVSNVATVDDVINAG